jgi:hypothetical protein
MVQKKMKHIKGIAQVTTILIGVITTVVLAWGGWISLATIAKGDSEGEMSTNIAVADQRIKTLEADMTALKNDTKITRDLVTRIAAKLLVEQK